MTTGQDEQQRAEARQTLKRYAGMGFNLVGAVLGFMAIGWLVDRGFGTRPTGVIVGAVLGVVGGMYNLIREALALSRAMERLDARSRDTQADEAPRPRDSASPPDDADDRPS